MRTWLRSSSISRCRRVLAHQIAATRGDLASQSRLGELAQEFGSAIGKHGALRNAIDGVDPQTAQWKHRQPDPEAYQAEFEPHARGALLVAAVFDAFLTIYRTRVADLLRIATQGTGVLPAGSLHPDLVRRLAVEASKSAQRVLEMCIRALDYCPPVDITFGDYLRAIITANDEYDPVDHEHRRVAFIDAFRRHGILPADVRTISVEGLLWRQTKAVPDADEEIVLDFMQDWNSKIQKWSLSRDRRLAYELMKRMRQELHQYLHQYLVRKSKQRLLSGFDPSLPFEVHSLRPSSRVDWRGQSHFQWVIEKPFVQYGRFGMWCHLLSASGTARFRLGLSSSGLWGVAGTTEVRSRQPCFKEFVKVPRVNLVLCGGEETAEFFGIRDAVDHLVGGSQTPRSTGLRHVIARMVGREKVLYLR